MKSARVRLAISAKSCPQQFSNSPIDERERITELLNALVMGRVARDQFQAVVMAMAAIIGSQRPIGRPTRPDRRRSGRTVPSAWSKEKISGTDGVQEFWIRLDPWTRWKPWMTSIDVTEEA